MDLSTAFKELADKVKEIVELRIRRYGVNPRTGTNTLQGSDLEKSIEISPTEDGIVLQIADYWEFVSRGWERTGNYPNTFNKFVENLTKWVRKKNIHIGKLSQNQIVWIVLNKIWTHGIKARPFMVYSDDGDLEKMIPELKGYMDKWFDELFAQIISDLDKYFDK